MAVYSTHNKYVSIPDWFTSLKKDASEKTAVSTAKLTVVVGGSSSGVSSGTGVSEINLYNKFVLTEVSLDKDALVNENVAIIAVKSEINNVGDLLTANGWYTTEYISIAANSLMTITASVHDNYGLVFYDNTKTVISGTVFTQSPQDVQVPKNAAYYRISSNDVESFSILYFIENAYSSELLEQSNSNIEDYLYLDASIPEGCNTVTFTDDSFNLLVQKPLLLTKDKNNIIKLSLPQSIDGVWELKTHEETLEPYIFTKYPVVTQYGVTMYADLNKLNLPDIYAGLPVDGTIVRNEDGVFGIPIDNNTIVLENGKLTVVGGTGGDVATEVAWANVKGKPSWLTDDKILYTEVEGLAEKLTEYVTFDENEQIEGVKDFLNGIKINGLSITNSQEDVIYIDSNLVVRGGITMYADNTVDVPSLMESIATDGTTIMNDGTKLYLNPNLELGGNGISSLVIKVGSESYTGTGTKDVTVTLPDFVEMSDLLNYVTKSDLENYTSEKYVTIAGNEEVTGIHPFVNGLKVGSSLINQLLDGVVYIDGHLAVKGGVTMYVDNGTIDLPNLYDGFPTDGTIIKNDDGSFGIPIDNSTIVLNNGKLTVVGGTDESGGLDDVNVTGTGNAITSASLSNNILTLTKGATFLDQLSGDSRYLLTSEYEGDYTAWGQTYWNKGKPASVKGDLVNVGNIKFETTGKNIGEWGKGAELTFSNAVISKGSGQSLWLVGSSYLDTNGVVFGRNDEGSRSEEIARINSIGLYPYNSNSLTLGTSSKLWKHVYTSEVTVDDINIKKSASGILYIDANLVVKGGVTMYATDATSSPSIIDSLPIANASGTKGIATFDATYFKVTDGKVTLVDDLALDEYITSLGTNGNYLTYTKNGVVNKVTVPYATTANKLSTARTISITGHATGSGSFDGYTDLGIKVTIPTRNVYINGVPYTVHSTITTDTTGIYAPTSGGTSGYVLNANGATSIPTWVAQSSLSVGYATRPYINNSSNKGIFPIIFTNISRCGAPGYDSLYVDTASGSGYNPSTNTFYATTFSGALSGNATSASKLTTVSKTAWGQTYWTSGGVPTSISGNMTGVGSITMNGSINYNDYTIFSYSASTGDGGVSTGASLLGSPSLATTLRSSGNDLYHWNAANSAKYLIFDTNNFTNYTNKALTKKNSGTNLLTDGDKYIGAQNYLIGTYAYASSVTNGVKYRCTLCGKLGDDNTHIAAYWDGGSGNNTTISGLSSTEERTISFTATITNKQRLAFYQFPNGKFGSYIKWCKLEVEEDVTGDTSTYLYNIDRIDFANDSNSHNFGIDRNGTVYGYNAGVLKLRRGKSSGGSYVQYEANNQAVYGWRAGANDMYNFSWWYYDTSSSTDVQKMYLDSSGNLLVTGGITMYSDERKKTIIRDVELSLKQVAEAPLVEHYYNSDEKKTTHVGSIAQYWAGLNDWFCKKDSDGYYTMEIQNVALASAISVARELSRFEGDTNRRIRLLEEENKKLKEEIEQLKTT